MGTDTISTGAREGAGARRRLRVVTWNVHRCRGLDGRTRPERIARVLRRIAADVVALQEVLSLENGRVHAEDQARFIAAALDLDVHHGTNRMIGAARYGNVVLTRLAGGPGCNYDISLDGFEPRGLLRVDLDLWGRALHVFNAHLGVSFAERRGQARLLDDSGLFDAGALPGPRVLVGDFNEWGPTHASRLLGAKLRRARHTGFSWPWSYPGLLPVVAIDRVYHDATLRLQRLCVVRSPEALIASDHVPVVADFELV